MPTSLQVWELPAPGVGCWTHSVPGAEEVSGPACQRLTVWPGRCPVSTERGATGIRPCSRVLGQAGWESKSLLSKMASSARTGSWCATRLFRALWWGKGQGVGLRVCRETPQSLGCEVSSTGFKSSAPGPDRLGLYSGLTLRSYEQLHAQVPVSARWEGNSPTC